MNVISLKALTCLLLVMSIALTSNFTLAENTDKHEVTTKSHMIYINESSLEQLLTLKGIGQKKAEAILAYRKKMGDFKSIEDLVNVKGISKRIVLVNKSRLKI
ncbi:MAG: helix-hairpin-helix domain-containing protein [Litorilituus sp.]|jgi:competence protein ComEA|nr:helix-hairpin-helix domain-containing protein [Litorilituus sp.]